MQERPSVGATRSAQGSCSCHYDLRTWPGPFDLLEPIKSAPLWTEQATGVAAPTMLNRQRQKRHFHAGRKPLAPRLHLSLIINWRSMKAFLLPLSWLSLDSGTGPIHPDLA